jgi:mono/diheme cytochrome c family protein
MTKRPGALAGALVFVALGLVAVAGVIGWAIGKEPGTTATTAGGQRTAPSGHSGKGLPPHEIGDAVRGATLFVSKGCANCHSFGGTGGTDAPALDYMAGHLSAREIANMSGTIWNHMPAMLPFFQQEGIPVPTFTGFEMANLIAYLHSKPSPKAAAAAAGGGEQGAMDMGAMEPGDPARGTRVFTTLGCGSCHTLVAAGSKGTIGPNLDTSLKGKSADFIEQSLLDPGAAVAKGYERNVMPTFSATMTEQQLADLVAFLANR